MFAELLLNRARDAVICIDDQGIVALFNGAAERMFGYSAAEILGQNVATLMPSPYREEHDRYLQNYRQTGVAKAIGRIRNVQARRKNGEVFPIELAVSPVPEGEGVAYVAIIRDVTERLRMEELALRAKEAAEAAAKTKSEFLAIMSHELRTPLSAIIGSIDLLLETELGSEQQQYADIALRNSTALLAVINDILDFSKIEARKLQLESVDFNLTNLVHEVVRLSSEPAARKGIALACELADSLPDAVQADPSRLRQVLSNLMANAIKFTEQGSVTLRARPVTQMNADVTVRFEVIDTGIGITPEERESLFRPFSQANMSTTRKYGGTGLGLAICRQLVELMGGHIDVSSEPGRGSRFWFTAKLVMPQTRVHARGREH